MTALQWQDVTMCLGKFRTIELAHVALDLGIERSGGYRR